MCCMDSFHLSEGRLLLLTISLSSISCYITDTFAVEVPKPAIVDPQDIIVRITGTTICGSDIHLLHAQILQLEKGDLLGHEFIGVIESVGPAVTKFKPGMRVVNSFCIACGECRYCREGLTTACDRTNASSVHKNLYGDRMGGIFGYSHFTGGYGGGQAEWVRVPKGEVNLLPIPDSIPDEKALYISDVLPTSLHAVTYTGVQAGDTVAIWGLGPIGFMACMWAFKKGAKRVIGIDNNWRCEWAQGKLPKLEVIRFDQLAKGMTVPTRIREMVEGGVDVAIEASGGEYGKSVVNKIELATGLQQDTAEMINECIESTRKFGRVGIIADYVGCTSSLPLPISPFSPFLYHKLTTLDTNHFNIGSVMERGIKMIGCGQSPVQKYWKDILHWVETGEVDPTMMLTHRFVMEDLAKSYKVLDQKGEGLVKCFVQTRHSFPRAQGTPELTRL